MNGTIEDLRRNVKKVWRSEAELDKLVPKAMTREQAADAARRALENSNTPIGTMGDPNSLLEDALGRFQEIPEHNAEKAREWCKGYKVVDEDTGEETREGGIIDDGRYFVPSEPDLDIVIIVRPQVVRGVDEDVVIERYMVMGRRPETVRGTCFACNNAEKRGRKMPKAHDSKCWRKRSWLEWTPFIGAWAHGIDDAEELAKELRSSWEATAEAKYDDNAKVNWSQVTELPFSNSFLNDMLRKQQEWDRNEDTED